MEIILALLASLLLYAKGSRIKIHVKIQINSLFQYQKQHVTRQYFVCENNKQKQKKKPQIFEDNYFH